MEELYMSEEIAKKCIAVHLPIALYDRLNEHKSKTGKSQSGLIIDFLEKGLNTSVQPLSEPQLIFFVKVRIDPAKMQEMGKKLQSGELDTSQLMVTYCLKDDPAVGMSFWKATSVNDFETNFARLVPYYKEVVEITQMVTPMDAMHLILAEMKHKI